MGIEVFHPSIYAVLFTHFDIAWISGLLYTCTKLSDETIKAKVILNIKIYNANLLVLGIGLLIEFN